VSYTRAQIVAMARSTVNAAKSELATLRTTYPTSGLLSDWVTWGEKVDAAAANAANAASEVGGTNARASLNAANAVAAQMICFVKQMSGQYTSQTQGTCSIFGAGPGGGTTVPSVAFLALASQAVTSADAAVTAAQRALVTTGPNLFQIAPLTLKGLPMRGESASTRRAYALAGLPRHIGVGDPASAATDATAQMASLATFFTSASQNGGATASGGPQAQQNLAALQTDVNTAGGFQGFSLSTGQAIGYGLGIALVGFLAGKYL
jgi:hypothetical protein